MKASFKARYEPEKANASTTVTFNAGDFRLRTSLTDATVVNGPSLNGLALAVEKPGFFMVDYNVPKKVTFFLLISKFQLKTWLILHTQI